MASFADEDEFDSDTSDDDYVPGCEGEALSEEEHSGEDEDFLTGEDATNSGTKKQKKGKGKKAKESLIRKRTGGIQLEEGEEEESKAEVDIDKCDSYNKQLAEQIGKEKELKKEEDQKKKADSLWADFMSDVGSLKPKPKPSSGGLASLSSLSKSTTSPSTAKVSSSSSSSPSAAKPLPDTASPVSSSAKPSKVTITTEYDFAGETVKISKEVDVNSKEAKAEMKKQEQKEEEKSKPSAGPVLSGLKRPGGGGLGSVLGKIGKKPKMSTLEKSKLDWNSFKQKEGIEEELQIHNRGKAGYIERKEFLERTDMRQFERERDVRLKMMNTKR